MVKSDKIDQMSTKDPSFYIVNLPEEDYIQCVLFALASYYNNIQTTMDFASTGVKRDVGDYVNDITIGKLAEMAVKRFLQGQYGLEADLDFDFYEDASQIDDGDIRWIKTKDGKKIARPHLHPIDIKSTKGTSKWLLIRKEEFDNRCYDMYVSVKISIPESHLVDFLGGEKIDTMVASLKDNSELSKKHMGMLVSALKKKHEALFPIKAEVMGWIGRNELIEKINKQRKMHAQLKILATEYTALKNKKREVKGATEQMKAERRAIQAKQTEFRKKMEVAVRDLMAVEFARGEEVFDPDLPHNGSFSIKANNYGVMIYKMNRDTDFLVKELLKPVS